MAGGAELPIKNSSPPPAGGPRPRLHRAQQGATNRTGIWIDHQQRAVPYNLGHTGQIASQVLLSQSAPMTPEEDEGVGGRGLCDRLTSSRE